MSPPKRFFFFSLKIEGASGFQTPSEDSLELCLSQTGLAKKCGEITSNHLKLKNNETCIRHKNIYFRILLIKRQYGSQCK